MANQKHPKRVMATGTFDNFHPGHLAYLKQASGLGDQLFVVVARDTTVLKIKGRKAAHNENERLTVIKKAGIATRVILGDRNDIYRSVENINPDIIALGYDQRVNEKELRKRFPAIQLVRLLPFEPEKYKSSLIITNP